MGELLHQYRFVAVVACLGLAAVLATPRGRVPLALRGLKKLLHADAGKEGEENQPSPGVSPVRRLFAFLLVVLAFAIAVLL